MTKASEILSAMYDKQVLVFGHRGAKAYAPMNTIPAFELAAEQGADGIELDVHRSRDGYPVIVHDFTVDETSDGEGRVTEMSLADLKALDAGLWFSPKFSGAKIPTLDEVFEAVGSKLYINVEIKSETVETDGVEEVVAECIRRHAMEKRVILSSFNPHTLQRFRVLMPDVPLAYLHATGYMEDHAHVMQNLAYEAYHPHHLMIDEAMVAREKLAGRIINTWTVNEPARAVELAKLGVKGIISDNPDTVIAALRAEKLL